MSNATPRSVGIKWGLYLGAASALYGLILIFSKLYMNQALGYVSYALSITGVVLALREFKGLNGGFMSLGQGFRTGLTTSVVAGVISSVVSSLYYLINPALKTEILDYAAAEMEKNPQMTPEAMEMGLGWAEKMMEPYIAIPFGILGSLIGGALISVIVAAIMKKDGAPTSGIEDIGQN